MGLVCDVMVHTTPRSLTICNRHVFPHHNRSEDETRITVMIGGSRLSREDIANLPEDKFLEIAERALREHMGIEKQPSILQVHRALDAIPL